MPESPGDDAKLHDLTILNERKTCDTYDHVDTSAKMMKEDENKESKRERKEEKLDREDKCTTSNWIEVDKLGLTSLPDGKAKMATSRVVRKFTKG